MSILGARRVWLKIHLYLGLFAGAVLVLLGVTGSVLVFSEDIDRLLTPQLAASSDVHGTATPDDVVLAVEARTGLRPYVVELPRRDQSHYVTFVEDEPGLEPRALVVDAATAEVLTDRRFGAYFVSFCRRLHAELMLKEEVGRVTVAWLGVAGLVSVFTGLYLWWPRGSAGLLRAMAFHRQRTVRGLNYELHRVAGFYLLVVLFVVMVSGIFLATPGPFVAAAGSFADVTPYPGRIESAPRPEGAQPLALADVARTVTERVPGAVVTGFYVPKRPEEAYRVHYRQADEPEIDVGHSALWIDQYTGRVLHSYDYANATVTDRVFALQGRLHNGEVLGTPGKWLVCIAGIVLMLLYATGFYLWWARRQARRAYVMQTGVLHDLDSSAP